jgi:hypothetical protein
MQGSGTLVVCCCLYGVWHEDCGSVRRCVLCYVAMHVLLDIDVFHQQIALVSLVVKGRVRTVHAKTCTSKHSGLAKLHACVSVTDSCTTHTAAAP